MIYHGASRTREFATVRPNTVAIGTASVPTPKLSNLRTVRALNRFAMLFSLYLVVIALASTERSRSEGSEAGCSRTDAGTESAAN